MKKRFVILMLALAAVSCSDWLVREPQDELSPDTYFTTEQECRLYTNRFYLMFPGGSGIYGEEADYIIESVKEVVAHLRSFSPVWRDLTEGKKEFILK